MFADDEHFCSMRTFWFGSEELLTKVLTAEIDAVTQLLARYPDLRNLFDAPEATRPQRTACFVLLAHRKIMEMAYETFTARHEQSPPLGDMESDAISRTQNLVAADAPAWVLEVNEVVERLPSYIYDALPEPLRTGGYDANNLAQVERVNSAAKTLSSVEQVRALTEGVIDQQLRRLERRWSATSTTIVQVLKPNGREPNKGKPSRRKPRRKRDKQRMNRDKLIAEIDDVTETPSEFMRLMDERKVQPQPTWTEWPGSWAEAYKNTRLRELIHKDKSRSLSRVRARRNR